MTKRTLLSVFNQDGRHVQALVQSMPRSFKMHVWANYRLIGGLETTELNYLGTITPMDQSDAIEIEQLIAILVHKELY